MRNRTVEQANKFVREIETDHLRDLVKKVSRAEEKAESKHDGGCGCLQCKKQHARAKKELQKELERLRGPGEEEE